MNINIFSPISTHTSYGLTSRNIITALSRLGHHICAINIPGNVCSFAPWETEVQQALKNGEDWDTDAPCLKIFHANEVITFPHCRGKKVAMVIFELSKLRDDEVRQLNKLDAVLVCSIWAKNVAISSGVTAPVFVAPLGVDSTIFDPNLIPSVNDISKDNALKFLFVGKWELRKAVPEVIEAFERAFTSTDDVVLIFNSFNAFIGKQRNDDWALYCKTSKLGPKIHVLENYLDTQKNVANLIGSVDIGLCLSRAEGWDLPALEFLSMGKHIIASNVTAHTEFLNKENAFLVDYPEMETANDGTFFSGFGDWAKISEKEIDKIASAMKSCYALKGGGRLGVNQAGIETAKAFNWTATAQACLEALE